MLKLCTEVFEEGYTFELFFYFQSDVIFPVDFEIDVKASITFKRGSLFVGIEDVLKILHTCI